MNPISLVANLVRYAAPVGLAAIGETVGQSAGVINIGLEGMMLASSFAAMMGSRATGNPFVGILCALLTGLVLGLFQSVFALWMAQDQVVVGTAVNLLALGGTSTLYRQVFGASGQLISVQKLPAWGEWDAVMVLLFLSAGAAAWALRRTNWGLACRAAGEEPKAIEAAGFSVVRVRLQAVCVGSLLAGLAGGSLALSITGSFAENMTAGRGFVALAMVTFGRWKPWAALAAALLIGAADWGQYALQGVGPGFPPQLLRALPYLLALAVLAFAGKGTRSPASLGLPFRREN